MPNNNRLYYALLQTSFAKIGTAAYIAAHGVQSVGLTTNYPIDYISELGQLAIYQSKEQLPNVEMTITKNLDGYPLVYHLATNGSTDATLVGRSNVSTIAALSFFADSKISSSGTPISELQMSGMFVSSEAFNFDVNGPFTESTTLVGTIKIWKQANFNASGQFTTNADSPLALASGWGGVQQRQNFVYAPSAGLPLDINGQSNATRTIPCSILPLDIPGISTSGTNQIGSDGNYPAHVQSMSVSSNFGREPLYELGHRNYFFRYIQFPVAVTTDITCLAHDGDLKSCTEAGVLSGVNLGNNLAEQTIKIATTEGTFIDLGTHNKLNTISYGGGDTGGTNLTETWSYTTQNDFSVYHRQDPSGL